MDKIYYNTMIFAQCSLIFNFFVGLALKYQCQLKEKAFFDLIKFEVKNVQIQIYFILQK